MTTAPSRVRSASRPPSAAPRRRPCAQPAPARARRRPGTRRPARRGRHDDRRGADARCDADFPELTISKIRYYERQGLLRPARSAAGYRKFSPADVARLHYILTAARDQYLPLKVIKERLEAADSAADAALPPLGGGRSPPLRRSRAAAAAAAAAAAVGVGPELFEFEAERRAAHPPRAAARQRARRTSS